MFKRKPEGRKVEDKKAEKYSFNDNKMESLGNKLGINSSGINYDKIKFELNRNKKNLKILGIDSSVLKEFGLE